MPFTKEERIKIILMTTAQRIICVNVNMMGKHEFMMNWEN